MPQTAWSLAPFRWGLTFCAMKKNRLGQEPAYPSNEEIWDGMELQKRNHKQGMSKRFYAACMAMQGILASADKYNQNLNNAEKAEYSFIMADELLKQENK